MPDRSRSRPRTLERNPDLVVASVYEREVCAALDSVWENVFDWEHLPWLHSQAFSSIELRDSGAWGWRAEIGFPGGARGEIELVAARDADHYVARTLEGAGAPGEIWTHLAAVGSEHTQIRVEFCVPPLPKDALEKVGAAYVALYTGLWDQDEGMMQTRERASAEAASAASEMSKRSERTEAPNEGSRLGGGAAAGAESVDLGPWDELVPRLPMLTEFGGHRFRIVALEGRPVAHSVQCPHWLGPLDDCPVESGAVTCPWHGYRFDIASGKSTEGRSLRLRPAPRLEVDARTGRVRMVAATASENPPGV